MTLTKRTSTGHELSDSSWLDAHFEVARPEYESALRQVGVRAGSIALDAGCGAGGFLPVLCESIGLKGRIVALDLAPENTALIEARIRAGTLPGTVETKVGNVLSLPFDDETFDFIWCANVAQYLTPDQFLQAIAEFRRVCKPQALIAIKEYDCALMDLQPVDDDYVGRLWAARRAKAQDGALGPWGGSRIPSLLLRGGLTEVSPKGWLVERWGPAQAATRAFVETFLPRWAGLAAQYELPAQDVRFWRELADDPCRLLDDPAFCYREFFVVTAAYRAM